METTEQLHLKLLMEQNQLLKEKQKSTNEQLLSLQRTLENLTLGRGPGYDRDDPGGRMDDRGLRLEIADFDGSFMDPEVYIEWERSLERFFDYKNTPEDQKCKLAKLKLSRHASNWFEGVQNQRRCEGKGKIQRWDKFKKIMRRRFVPSDYQQQLFIRWSSLRQASKTVSEYLKEFETLTIACGINEREEVKVGRFIGGLADDIREKMETHLNVGFMDACKLAATYEKHRKKKYVPSNSAGSSSRYDSTSLNKDGGIDHLKQRPTKPKESKQEAKKELKDILCFKCHGSGHYQRDCPNPRALTAMEVKEIHSRTLLLGEESPEEPLKLTSSEEDFFNQSGTYVCDDDGKKRPYQGDSDEDDKTEICHPETIGQALMLRKVLSTRVVEGQHKQRNNIFQTKCRVQGEIYDLIVDGGAEVNVVSKDLVSSLCLHTTRHPRPHKLSWLDQGKKTQVRRQCLVNFQVGAYKDAILCDVVEMDACHILLGRPWQSDRHSKHDGYANIYTIEHEGKKKQLLPLPPKECVPPMKTREEGSLFGVKSDLMREEEQVKRAAFVKQHVKQRQREYQPGDLVFVDVHKGKFRKKVKKGLNLNLLASEGPFEVLGKTSANWYGVQLSKEPMIAAAFKIEELTPYFDDDLQNLRANSFEEGGFDPYSHKDHGSKSG